jgi:acyl carrier protein
MTIDTNDLKAVLATILVRLPGHDDDDLWDSGLMDSMAVVAVVAALEERFGIEFGPQHLRKENFQSIAHIRSLLETIRAGGRA